MTFRTTLGETVFKQKYASNQYEQWDDRVNTIVNDICGNRNGTTHHIMAKSDQDHLAHVMSKFQVIPGGRYIYYAGRDPSALYINNCYLLRLEEDTREEWSAVTQRAMSCLMTGGGIGIDVSAARPSGRQLRRTGGVASGPIPLLYTINEVGRNVMQGGSRRSAMYGSLNWQHEDARQFMTLKNWHMMPIGQSGMMISEAKEQDFN